MTEYTNGGVPSKAPATHKVIISEEGVKVLPIGVSTAKKYPGEYRNPMAGPLNCGGF